MGAPGFWDSQDRAKEVIAQQKQLNVVLKPFEALAGDAEELQATVELADEDESLEAEVEPLLLKVEKQINEFELRSMFDGPADANSAYLKVQAGTGGTEACDWAQM